MIHKNNGNKIINNQGRQSGPKGERAPTRCTKVKMDNLSKCEFLFLKNLANYEVFR